MADNRPEPRTEAGRRMLRRRSYWSGNDDIRAAILAIEAEAASPAALDVIKLARAMESAGIRDAGIYADRIAAEYAALAHPEEERSGE